MPSKVHKLTDEWKKHISESNKRFWSTKEGKELKHLTGMYGKHHTENTRKRISKSLKGKNFIPQENRKGMLGKTHREESKQKIRKALIGHKVSEETRQKIRMKNLGRKPPIEEINKIRRFWKNEQNAQEMFRKFNKRPTKIEQFFIDYFKQNNLPYKYVGNGKFWIEGKCPDFVNVNGKKICIEVGSKNEKKWRYNSFEQYIQERSEHFLEYGWKVSFYWIEDFKDSPKQ